MSEHTSSIMREITPLSERDCFYIADRRKSSFDYPIHCHPEFELNFVENARGVRRTVGDHTEEIGDYDLVLIASSDLEHVWEQGNCQSEEIREITIQFTRDFLPPVLLQKNQFESIRRMLERAQCGLSFPVGSIMRVYNKLDTLTSCSSGFYSVLSLFEILYELSICYNARTLSSSSYARVENHHESRRVNTIQKYIAQHYREDIHAETLAELINMSTVAFSRFFHQRTGRTFSDYLIDIRLGHATRLLIDSSRTVAEVCYDCGFNTLSNFNRLFRRYKGCSPTQFRENFQKKKVIV